MKEFAIAPPIEGGALDVCSEKLSCDDRLLQSIYSVMAMLRSIDRDGDLHNSAKLELAVSVCYHIKPP